MPVKATLIMAMNTVASDPTVALSRAGGWSETLWSAIDTPITADQVNRWALARALLLPKQAAVVGARQGIFTISGNKLLPGGTSASKFFVPGNSSYSTDVPQLALELSGTSSVGPNGNRFALKCLPDDMCVTGEYAPSSSFRSYVANYIDFIMGRASFTDMGRWSFPMRVKTNAVANVQSITAPGVVTLSAAVGGTPGTSYLRLNKVYGVGGVSVQGRFLITAIAGSVYTLQAYTGHIVNSPSGQARLDEVTVQTYGSVAVSGVVVRKIGRPSRGFRGKGSRHLAA